VLRQKQCRSFVVLDFVDAGIRAPRPVALASVNTSSAKMVFELAQLLGGAPLLRMRSN
jgi:hypothetical protein